MADRDMRIEKMNTAAKDPIVALHKFNKLRSKDAKKLIFVFEGNEDPIFYSTMADKCGFKEPYSPLVVNGKDFVLGLRKLLTSSKEALLGDGVAFFVDHDFDGLKGHPLGEDIFCTPTYSIENIVTQTDVVRKILLNELKLHDPDLLDDFQKCTDAYLSLSRDFITEMRDLNLLIYFGRTQSLDKCGSQLMNIDDNRQPFVIDREKLVLKSDFRGNEAKKVARFNCDFDFSEAETVDPDFSALDPTSQWRGKFWLELLRKFFEILVEDRNSENPIHFKTGKGKITLSLTGDARFRLLGSACEVPLSLRNFFSNLPQAALH